MIERQTVEEVLARTDMVSLVSAYVTLKRAGSNMSGLCPFHSERSPSFTVFPADNSFYCFGCGVGGNAITFMRKIENLDFADAVTILANRAGITVREENGLPTPRVDKKRYFQMNKIAARFFHQSLFADTPKAKAALAYFTEERKLSSAIIKHFGLGYAPDNFSFVNYMKKAGYTDEELIKGYLCHKNEKGNMYPAFRNRVMFPIIDVAENVIAFGGRVMDDSKPKYKNSSDTPVYEKRKNLFALNFSHKNAAERLILCEGYMDVIALHAAGFPYAVATLGTAITSEQARLMARYTKRVIISYDSDEAGQTAADKAMRLLEAVGLSASVLKIPDAKDPDEYIRKFGTERFKAVLDQSKSKFEFYYEKITEKYELSIPQQKIEALQKLCDFIATVPSAVEREIYMQETAKRLDVAYKGVEGEVRQRLSRLKGAERAKTRNEARAALSGVLDKVNPDYAKLPKAAKAEETILGLLQLFADLRAKLFDSPPILAEEDFYTDLGRRVFRFILTAEQNGGFSTDLLDSEFSADEVGRITKMRVARMQLTTNDEAVFIESVTTLKNAVRDEKDKKSTESMDDLMNFLQKKREEQ